MAIAAVSPLPPERLQEIKSWDVHLLSVRIDRLNRCWQSGLLCIGDAAHAMSPIAGVGINRAIQDAVAAANILAEPLRNGTLSERHLVAVQARRVFAAKAMQRLHLMMRPDHYANTGAAKRTVTALRPLNAASRAFLSLAHLAGRLIGLGFRPERVRSRDMN